MRSVLSILIILAMAGGTAQLLLEAVVKQQDMNDRATLERCQEGYTHACKQWQKIAMESTHE